MSISCTWPQYLHRFVARGSSLIFRGFGAWMPVGIIGAAPCACTVVVWGNTYLTNINPLFILQKRAVRTMTFCKFDEHSSPLFKQTNILKLFDLIKFQISIFMYKFHKNRLPAVFDSYFLSISKVHNHSTRLSSTHAYALPKARTNNGKFTIKFIGAKVWNALDADLKTLSFRTFKARLKENFTLNY